VFELFIVGMFVTILFKAAGEPVIVVVVVV
jgi:hypothetical protein